MGDLHKLGPKGEEYALGMLRKRGHRLLQRNFRCPPGEIDLITWHRKTLVFTEVRARSERAPANPVETVTPEKQTRIVRAARWYLARWCGKKEPPAFRFDIVWLTAKDAEITAGGVIEGAFGM
ncbi:MAG: YraN family protein [Planctomycetes bacterium]|nr:YraN family protein [Planctomycetota bacterium]